MSKLVSMPYTLATFCFYYLAARTAVDRVQGILQCSLKQRLAAAAVILDKDKVTHLSTQIVGVINFN